MNRIEITDPSYSRGASLHTQAGVRGSDASQCENRNRGDPGEFPDRCRPERRSRICFRYWFKNWCEQDKICAANLPGIRNPMARDGNQEARSRKYFRQDGTITEMNALRAARDCYVRTVVYDYFRRMRIR